VTANARLTGLAPGPAAPSPYGSTELREPSGPDLAKDGLSKPSLCWQTAISPDRTQDVAGSSPASSTFSDIAQTSGVTTR
jgi:hypothetical protein